jgi:translation initiation factor IF-1
VSTRESHYPGMIGEHHVGSVTGEEYIARMNYHMSKRDIGIVHGDRVKVRMRTGDSASVCVRVRG